MLQARLEVKMIDKKAHTMWKLIKGFYKDFIEMTRPENNRDLYKLTGKHEEMSLWYRQILSSFLVIMFLKIIHFSIFLCTSTLHSPI